MRRPRIAESLLRGFIADPDLEDAILGDLAEGWGERAERAGGPSARSWYWGQVLRSAPHLLREWWLQQSPAQAVRILGRVALVLLVAMPLAAATTAGLLIVAGGAPGSSAPDVTRAMIIAGGAWAGIAGFVVAQRAADAPMASALLLALSWLPASVPSGLAHPSPGPPDWFPVLFPALLFALSLAGGAVATVLRGPRSTHDPLCEADSPTPETSMNTDRNLLRLFGRPLLAAAILLMVPLVAMQLTGDVSWAVSDFAIMGILIFGTGVAFELALVKADSTAYRAAGGVALASAFLLVWVNLAVGIIGSSAHGANALYAGVLAVGVVGSLVARFRPRGMARAMVATALAHAGVGVAALMAGWGSPSEVVGMTGMFVVLFLGSAWLFNAAAGRRGQRADGALATRSGEDENVGGNQNGTGTTMAVLRPIFRTIGMGVSWAVGWAAAGVLTGIALGFLPDGHPLQSMIDPWMALATPGFIGGVVFSVLLRIGEGRQEFPQLSLSRAAAWGAATGLLLGSIPFFLGTPTDEFPLWKLVLGVISATTLLSTGSAWGSLTLARKVAVLARTS